MAVLESELVALAQQLEQVTGRLELLRSNSPFPGGSSIDNGLISVVSFCSTSSGSKANWGDDFDDEDLPPPPSLELVVPVASRKQVAPPAPAGGGAAPPPPPPPPPPSPGGAVLSTVEALYPYSGEAEGSVSMDEGEKFQVKSGQNYL